MNTIRTKLAGKVGRLTKIDTPKLLAMFGESIKGLSLTSLGRIAKCRSGASAVEFAIIAPIFIMLVMAIIAYGIYFSAEHAIQQITADAARTALSGITDEERTFLVNQYIEGNAEQYPFIDTENLNISVFVDESNSNELTVTVSYDATDLPIWGLWRDLPMPGTTILKQSTIRLGGT